MISRGDDHTVEGAECSEYLRHHKLAAFCDYLRFPGFAAAFLSAKRKQRCGSVGVPVVYDGAEPVEFGRPCYWKEGIAQRVLKKELRVETIEVTGLDEEEDCLDDIESSSFSFTCVHQSLGARKVQEDRFMCKELLEDISYVSFFGVYDGHGGAEAADYLCKHLHVNFAEALRSGRRPYRGRLAQALRTAFRRTDEALLTICRSEEAAANDGREESSGAAAAVVVLLGRKLVVAHVGDCRVVLCRERRDGDGGNGNACECIELTADHKYSNARERERVQQRGGAWDHRRLNSVLEVSRAFGDYDFAAGCKHRGLSAEPEVTEHSIEPGDEFLVLATDGLWSDDPSASRRAPGRGFGNSAEAVRFIRRQLRTNGNNAEKTLENVVEEAVRCDESDNTTAVLVAFKHLPQEPLEAVKEIRFSKERPRFINTNKPRP